jgi:molybdenum cofactor guanylyltransferase
MTCLFFPKKGISIAEIKDLRHCSRDLHMGFLLDISCIALAGGKSARLGRNKLLEMIGDTTLFQRVLDKLVLLNGEIIIVTPDDTSLPDLKGYSNLRIIGDTYPNRGALGGVYAGLSASNTHYNVVVAGDMPFLNTDLLQFMLDAAVNHDLVAYRDGDRFEPLHAVYSRNCIEPLKQLLACDNVRIIEILHLVKTRLLSAEELARFDPQHLSFFNINTEKELQAARAIIKSHD